ncbi:toprim domain-containing protein [Acidisoma sp. S159]|uniref:toprim domain-containing protein n=1 Tax=Acidisoma sp. S159 TaxID=1747225 RepID=UPI00131B5CA2|nr:toprim domain-containing protein [Acidisoma sp. S159]
MSAAKKPSSGRGKTVPHGQAEISPDQRKVTIEVDGELRVFYLSDGEVWFSYWAIATQKERTQEFLERALKQDVLCSREEQFKRQAINAMWLASLPAKKRLEKYYICLFAHFLPRGGFCIDEDQVLLESTLPKKLWHPGSTGVVTINFPDNSWHGDLPGIGSHDLNDLFAYVHGISTEEVRKLREEFDDILDAHLRSRGCRLPGRDSEDDDDALDPASAEDHALLEDLLRERVEDWPEEVASERNYEKSSGSEWRWGDSGRLRLIVSGHRKGNWNYFGTDERGGPLEFIARERECSPDEAFQWASEFVGGKKPAPDPKREKRRAEREAQAKAEEAAQRERKAQGAYNLARQTIALDGTIGERYLTETRRIPKPEQGWPITTRYHPISHSVLLIATTADTIITGVQRIFLTPDGKKIEKKSNGVFAGAAVKLPGDPVKPLHVSEGPETGLSVWAATESETHLTLGSMANYRPPNDGRRVVFCRDRDLEFSDSDLSFNKGMGAWARAGREFVIASPYDKFISKDEKDFNDLLQKEGIEAVCARINQAQAPRAPVTRLTLAEGRAAVATAFGQFFERVRAGNTEATTFTKDGPDIRTMVVDAIRVDLGVGKSTEALRQAAKFLAALREKNDNRAVGFAVPTLKLAEELAATFNAQGSGLLAAVRRGRRAPDPEAEGETMCRNLKAVEKAREVHAEVDTACCKNRKKKCPLYDLCGTQKQKRRRADIWFFAHPTLFGAKPEELGELACLIIDESPWESGLIGVSGPPLELPLDALREKDEIINDEYDTAQLRKARDAVLNALEDAPDGPVSRENLKAGLTNDIVHLAQGFEWRRKVKPLMTPDMSAEERTRAAEAAARNKTIGRCVLMWKAMEHLLRTFTLKEGEREKLGVITDWSKYDFIEASGRLSLGRSKDGARVLRIKGVREITQGWQKPTMLMDATMNPALLKHFWPLVKVKADVRVATPHQHVRQIIDRGFSKSSLRPATEGETLTGDDLKKQARRDANRGDLNALITKLAQRYPAGRVLVVMQKAIEESIGPLPASVETAHHNNVAGRDEWGPQPARDGKPADPGVACLIVVGCTNPTMMTIEHMAEGLTGRVTEPRPSNSKTRLRDWPRLCAEREMAGGGIVYGAARRHWNTTAEAVRWQINEAQLLQIIGRCRGVSRTEANPVDVWLLTDVPLPVPVEEVVRMADLIPGMDEMMLREGGIAFENSRDAVRVYPQLWKTAAAAQKARQREEADKRLETYSSIGLSASSWVYRKTGAGQKTYRALIDQTRVPDAAAKLAALLGPLALCRLV